MNDTDAKKSRWRTWALRTGAILGAGAALFATALVWTTDGLAAFGKAPGGERLDRMKKSERYEDDHFVNVEPTSTMSIFDSGPVIREYMFGDQERVPERALPVEDPTEVLAEPPESGLRITWMGHSSLLIEIDGARILTDPVWGLRASPTTVAGPVRFHDPPLPLEELGRIDAVVISHDHYDHLDLPSIKRLIAMGVPRFFVPLGIGSHLEYWGVDPERIIELEWWQERTLEEHGVRLVSTPARHFSGRNPFAQNNTLWTSWTLIGPDHRVYFSGDTGPTKHFEEIGEKFGPFDVTMLEVGAYNVAWGLIHLGPENALDAHEKLGGELMLPVHWGTFELALHGSSEPARDLERMAK